MKTRGLSNAEIKLRMSRNALSSLITLAENAGVEVEQWHRDALRDSQPDENDQEVPQDAPAT
jgi:hypothetical protein